jgi:thioredoxin reductase (NADPH)
MIAVAGGGDSATKEALLLTQWGSKVTMFARGEKLRAEPINLERAKNNPKLEVVTKTNIVEVKGGVVLQSLILDKEFNGSKEFPVDALFVEIGHLPVSELAKQLGVAVNEKEEIIIDRDSKTSVPGVFAAGDVCDSKFKQAITGVAEGVCAAHSAYQFVSSNGLK